MTMSDISGKEYRSLQRKAKKLAKEDDGKSEADILAELLAEQGLDKKAEAVKESAEQADNKQEENGEVENEADARTVSAILSSHPLSRDVHLQQFTLLFHGYELLMDAKFELNHGRCDTGHDIARACRPCDRLARCFCRARLCAMFTLKTFEDEGCTACCLQASAGAPRFRGRARPQCHRRRPFLHQFACLPHLASPRQLLCILHSQ